MASLIPQILKASDYAKRLRINFVSASSLLKEGKNLAFVELQHETFLLTKHLLLKDSDYCENFFTEYIPGVFNGTHDIISCSVNEKTVATVIFEKEARAIDLLYVEPYFRKRGIATALLEKFCFSKIRTAQPRIIIPGFEKEEFSGIIKKYRWVESRIIEPGLDNHCAEYRYVFNA